MPLSETQLETLTHKLQSSQRFLIVSHIRPDGDAIGSLLGIGLALLEVGKDVHMVLADGVPSNYRFLEGSNLIKTRADGIFDFVCLVDCSDLRRAGGVLNDRKPDVVIDHHVTNDGFGKINLIESDAVATSEILADYLPVLGLPITQPVANALLTGIVTDTLGFRTSNVSSKSLRIAASLIDCGANMPDLYFNSLVSRSFAAARYWGEGLSKLERDEAMVWTCLTNEERHLVGYPGRDDADLITVISSIEEMDIALIFVEQADGHVKISWRVCPRADARLDVSQVARLFGGGGHKNASGADLYGNLADVKQKVLATTRELLVTST